MELSFPLSNFSVRSLQRVKLIGWSWTLPKKDLVDSFFSFEIFMYLYSGFYSMCSKYSLDFTYLEAKFICRFQGSRPIMTMPKRSWVLQRKWVWSPPAPHRYANFYSNHVRLHDYCSWWRLDMPMGSNIICITFNFICQTYACDLPARAMARDGLVVYIWQSTSAAPRTPRWATIPHSTAIHWYFDVMLIVPVGLCRPTVDIYIIVRKYVGAL